jgi:hypothetical protein
MVGAGRNPAMAVNRIKPTRHRQITCLQPRAPRSGLPRTSGCGDRGARTFKCFLTPAETATLNESMSEALGKSRIDRK